MVFSVHFQFGGDEINEQQKMKLTTWLIYEPGRPFKDSELQELL